MNPNVDAVRAAVEGLFGAGMTAQQPLVPVQWPGMPPVTEDLTKAYCRFTLLPGEGRRVSVGIPGLARWAGVIIVQCFTPMGKGHGPGYRLADTVGAILSDKQLQAGGIVRLLTASTRFVGEDRWCQHNVSVPFNFDRAG